MIAGEGIGPLTSFSWFRDSSLSFPAEYEDAVSERVRSDGASMVKCPIGQALGLSECFKTPDSPFVSLLDGFGDPATIVRTVPPAVVDPVDFQIGFVAVAGRPLCERGKDSPRFADGNPATTVEVIGGMFGVATSLEHRTPGVVQFGAALLSGIMAVASTRGCELLKFQAPAGARVSYQFGSPDIPFDSAGAEAAEQGDVINRVSRSSDFTQRSGDHGPTAKDITCFDAAGVHASLLLNYSRKTTEGNRVDASGNRTAITLTPPS